MINDPKKKSTERARLDGTKRGYAERQPGQQPVDEVPDEQVERDDGGSVTNQGTEEMGGPKHDARPMTPFAGHPDISNEKSSKDDPGSVRGGARNPAPEL